jgi:hypothetical protein
VRSFEWATLAFAAYSCVVVSVQPGLSPGRRSLITAASLLLGALAAGTPRAPWAEVVLVRDWLLPGLYLIASYRISGASFVSPMPRIERWLVAVDARLGAGTIRARLPKAAAQALELAYVLVYPLVAFGPLIALRAGGAAALERSWLLILVTDYICFGCLPWIQTRTPRGLEGEPRTGATRLRRVNVALMRRMSTEMNTVPSGHAAEGIAVVLALAGPAPRAALALLPLGLAVAAGSVVGRYHFAADALAGFVVAIAVWAVLG